MLVKPNVLHNRGVHVLAIAVGLLLSVSGIAALADDAATTQPSNQVPTDVKTACSYKVNDLIEQNDIDDSYNDLQLCHMAIARQIAQLAATVSTTTAPADVCYFDGKPYSEGAELDGQHCVRVIEPPPAGMTYRWSNRPDEPINHKER